MFTVTYKGFPVACETAAQAVDFIDAADKPARITAPEFPQTTTRAKPRKVRKIKDQARVEKRKAKARAAYLEKHPAKPVTSTTSRLEALPSDPKGRGKGSRANTGQAVIDTLKRSPSPLTVDEIDTDLEKSGWPYKGTDRKGAIRATLARLKANGTVSIQKKGTGMDAHKMFRLERTNGETPSPVEQAIENGKDGAEQAAIAAAEAAAEAESDPPDSQRDFL